MATCYDAPHTEHSCLKGDSGSELQEQTFHTMSPELSPGGLFPGQLNMGFAMEYQKGITSGMVSD